jgi:hypothetical protein
MQAVCVQKPFAAAGVSAIRSSSTRAVGVVRAAAAQPEAAAELRLPRRALAGLLAAVPVLLPASRALALIPDDDDEDLIERARANRKNKLASERQTEKAFSRSAKGLGGCRRCHRTASSCCCRLGLPREGRLPAWLLDSRAACCCCPHPAAAQPRGSGAACPLPGRPLLPFPAPFE